MNLEKNTCISFISRIKKNIDETPDRMRYLRRDLEEMIEYIKQLKAQEPDISINELNDIVYNKMKHSIRNMSTPNLTDIYLYKTAESLLKDIDLMYKELDNIRREKFADKRLRLYKYTNDMQRNTKTITEDILAMVLKNATPQFREKFVNSSLSDSENEKLKEAMKIYLEEFYKQDTKGRKRRYANKLVNILQLLKERGLLNKYNEKNNETLDRIGLPMLKFKYESQKDKSGIEDLSNIEVIGALSIEEIIAMTSFYSNRLAKEAISYNEALYIVRKMGIIEQISEQGDYKLEITDEELREMLAQYSFLAGIGKEVLHESVKKYDVYNCEPQVEIDLDDSKVKKDAIKLYEKDYQELYSKLFLTDFHSEFEMDLDIATILEADRYNLYSMKDDAMETLMVILNDKDKSKNMNWGYIPELKNGKNTIQNREKFILVGIDMKGFNMPIKLHFERGKLETFLRNYTGDTRLPIYEGNEDMKNFFTGFITTQICRPLTKSQRKQLNEKKVEKSNYKYGFLEHIKWMMHPNRYPDYLCDSQGKKKPKRHIDISSGRINKSGEEPEL